MKAEIITTRYMVHRRVDGKDKFFEARCRSEAELKALRYGGTAYKWTMADGQGGWKRI
jgi:hypothetical protein